MKVIISPAKKMRADCDDLPVASEPVYLDRAQVVLDWLRTLSYAEARALWTCSDAIARPAYDWLQLADLRFGTVSAVLSYDGIAFAYMAAGVMESEQLRYLQDHLVILSALYGALRPFDGVVPYRLEMQEKAHVAGTRNLYDFWGDAAYRAALDEDRVIVNLASKEYSRMVERHLRPGDRMVTCTFASQVGGRLVQKGVYCKMARGEMVRYMAVHGVTSVEELAGFDSPDWAFREDLSTPDELVFVRRR